MGVIMTVEWRVWREAATVEGGCRLASPVVSAKQRFPPVASQDFQIHSCLWSLPVDERNDSASGLAEVSQYQPLSSEDSNFRESEVSEG